MPKGKGNDNAIRNLPLVTTRLGFLKDFGHLLGRTPKGSYSPRGHSRHLLENLLRTTSGKPPLRTLSYTVKAIAGPLLATLLRTLTQNPSPEPLPEPSQNPC